MVTSCRHTPYCEYGCVQSEIHEWLDFGMEIFGNRFTMQTVNKGESSRIFMSIWKQVMGRYLATGSPCRYGPVQ